MGTLILLCSEKMATMSRVAFKIAFSGSVKGIPARALSTTATCNGGGPPIEDLPFPQRIRNFWVVSLMSPGIIIIIGAKQEPSDENINKQFWEMRICGLSL